MTQKINQEILAAVNRPGGAYGDELATISPTYREDLTAMIEIGIPIEIATDPAGRRYAYLKAIDGTAAPIAPPEASAPLPPPVVPQPGSAAASAPPAEAPPAPPEVSEAAADTEPAGDYDIRFTANELRVWSKEGGARIQFAAAGTASAQAALLYAMTIPARAVFDVRLKLTGTTEPPEKKAAKKAPSLADVAGVEDELESPAAEGGPMPLYQYRCPACDTLYEELQRPDDVPAPCPGCRTPGERQISAPAPAIIKGTEKNPYKKSKQQLSQEIDEQIRDNEIPPDLADAQAKLADL